MQVFHELKRSGVSFGKATANGPAPPSGFPHRLIWSGVVCWAVSGLPAAWMFARHASTMHEQ